MSEGYSLEKWRNAPERTLTPEDEVFIEDINSKIEAMTERLRERPNAPVRAFLMEMFRPSAWKILLSDKKVNQLLAKDAQSKEGQMAFAHAEAEALNEEYDRKAKAVEDAIADFATFIEKINGRSEDSPMKEAASGSLERVVKGLLERLNAQYGSEELGNALIRLRRKPGEELTLENPTPASNALLKGIEQLSNTYDQNQLLEVVFDLDEYWPEEDL